MALTTGIDLSGQLKTDKRARGPTEVHHSPSKMFEDDFRFWRHKADEPPGLPMSDQAGKADFAAGHADFR